MERKGIVTFKGKGMTLVGQAVKAGDKAPQFKALDNKLNEVTLKDFTGKVKLISVTPSLDTPVCDAQARRFNIEAAKLPDSCVVVNVSMDLPFAISRFCATAGIEKVKTLSDHRDAFFRHCLRRIGQRTSAACPRRLCNRRRGQGEVYRGGS